jgi:copper chaperone
MKTTIKINGMSCSHCENRVKNALLNVPGVTDAEVSAKDGSATVTHEGADINALAAAVEDAGYDVVK